MKLSARRLYQKLKFWQPSPPSTTPHNKLDSKAAYGRLVQGLQQTHDADRAMQLAVGGEFAAVGQLELETLKFFGLAPTDYVIDVGCGSGRLAQPLATYLKGRYLGIDIVPELVNYAREIVGRSDWQFAIADGLKIPETAAIADFVCFFSVFTHLLHEQSYAYLLEAKRVLKPGGKIVFSFLDFTVPGHWDAFQVNLNDLEHNAQPLNMFMSKAAIPVWADHLGLTVTHLYDGHEPFVPLATPIVLENGNQIATMGTIGQSVAVLEKP